MSKQTRVFEIAWRGVMTAALLGMGACSSGGDGEDDPPPTPAELTGVWATTYDEPATSADGGLFVVTFLANGRYFLMEVCEPDDGATTTAVERGNFTWNRASGAFDVSGVTETDDEDCAEDGLNAGDAGPYFDQATFNEDGTLSMRTIDDDVLILGRMPSAASSLTGAWTDQDEAADPGFVVAFFADNTYLLGHDARDEDCAGGGVERGRYAYDIGTSVFTTSAIDVDGNGDDCGLGEITADDNVRITFASATTALFDAGLEDQALIQKLSSP